MSQLRAFAEFIKQNKHPDVFQVLKDGPEMKKLTEERKVAMKRLSELDAIEERNDTETKERNDTQERLEVLERQIEALTKKFITQGIVPKALGEAYVRENTRMGWRHGGGKETPDPKPGQTETERREQIASYQKTRESNLVTTKYFDEKEREASKLSFGEEGKMMGASVKNDDGTVSGEVRPMYEKTDYAVDPKTGTFHQGRPVKKVVGQVEAPYTGRNIYSGKDMIEGQLTDQVQTTHHSSILAGEAVAGAGEIKFDFDGNIVMINNSSGHYKPGAKEMITTVEILIKAGALLDHAYTDPEGKPPDGAAKKLYDAAMRVQNQLVVKLRNGESVDNDQELLAKAKSTLKKMGYGPAERFVKDGNKTLSFVDVNDKMTGLEVKKAFAESNAKPITAAEFLSSGGSNKAQAAYKASMHQELEKTRADEKKKLDDKAEKLQEDYQTAEVKLADMEKRLLSLPSTDDQTTIAKRKDLQEQIEKLKGIVQKRKNIKDTELAELTEMLDKRLHELIGVGADEEEAPAPPMPDDWADNYQEDPEGPESLTGRNLAKKWAMEDNVEKAYELWVKKLKAKSK